MVIDSIDFEIYDTTFQYNKAIEECGAVLFISSKGKLENITATKNEAEVLAGVFGIYF